MPTNVTWNNTTYAIPLAGELNWASLSNFLIDLGNNAGITNVMKQAISIKTSSPVSVSSTSDFCIVTDLTVAGAVAVNLPAGVTKQLFAILDGKGDAATNNITITGNGGQTINGSATYVLDKNRACAIIQFDGTEWRILASFQVSGQITNADVATNAAIARSKLANGTADYVLINNGSGVMSEEAQLARTRGGTGVSSTATFPTSGVVVTEAATETLTNKTLTAPAFDTYADWTEIADPSSPASGVDRMYFKADGNAYRKNSAGVVQLVGGNASGGQLTVNASVMDTTVVSGTSLTHPQLVMNHNYTVNSGGSLFTVETLTIASGKTLTVASGGLWRNV